MLKLSSEYDEYAAIIQLFRIALGYGMEMILELY